ncbi:nitroreductase family protein [Enterocloster clostridioformis]|uniref:nitroreductase family protein n=1 Tax=Enterocloster clostridioformis TaxID=1531 RepID=UPI0018AC4C1B|nr:nitroreductase family protein [Enterocloster clostridioformis]MDB2128015.1 nitroreductase family protein [Enterocloster clostridioformis]MDU1962882.1 nitroreductase family protein [Enterocloster clostridioformis]
MEFYQVINRRRTVRDLKNDPISADMLERIITAGIQAPTHDHRREWEFVILREEEEKENALQFVKAFADAQGENRFVSASASPQQKMYADAMPKQYSMLSKSGCVILPFFKGGNSLFYASSVSTLNSFASVWCCIENIFLAATAEGLACSMRIPVGNEGLQVAETVHAPKGYILPCYIGLGYPAKDAAILEQEERPVTNTLHFGKW